MTKYSNKLILKNKRKNKTNKRNKRSKGDKQQRKVYIKKLSKYGKSKSKQITYNKKLIGGNNDPFINSIRLNRSETNPYLIYLSMLKKIINTDFKDSGLVIYKDYKMTNLTLKNDLRKKYLFVIDMQNDFVDQPYTEIDSTTEDIGKLAVADGKQCLEDIITFITNNHESFEKIYFTRDYHPEEHCSFFNVKTGLGFPEHCVQGTAGSKLCPDLEKLLKTRDEIRTKSQILFKAFHSDTESFGGNKYQNNYFNSRQLACSSSNDKNKEYTGAYPIKGLSTVDALDYNETLNFNADQEQFINVSNSEKKIDLDFNFDKELEEDCDVYVVGLAGDFCVQDTAINLSHNDNIKNIYVINDLTRYVLLPTHFLTEDKIQELKNTSKEKGMDKYVIKYDTKSSDYKILTKDEIQSLNVNELKKTPNEGETSEYYHFGTNPRDLIDNYINFTHDKKIKLLI